MHKNTLFFGQFEKKHDFYKEKSFSLLFLFLHCARIWALRSRNSTVIGLILKGVNRMAQKVGEEAVETVIEATNGTEDGLIYEASDLIYHLIVLLTSKGLRLEDLARELKKRHKG